MTRTEAKMRILAEWRTWIGHREISRMATSEDATAFYDHIETGNPDLLSFEESEPKAAVLEDWLARASLIKLDK